MNERAQSGHICEGDKRGFLARLESNKGSVSLVLLRCVLVYFVIIENSTLVDLIDLLFMAYDWALI